MNVKMIRWIRKRTTRLRRLKIEKLEQDFKNDTPKDYLDHTYEEIPDVIPWMWKGARSDSVPSFFLVGTSCVSDGEESITEACAPYYVASLTESYAYETPTVCSSSTENLNDPATSEDKTDSLNREKRVKSTGNNDKEEQRVCSHDRLSCVSVSCKHSHGPISQPMAKVQTTADVNYTTDSGACYLGSVTSDDDTTSFTTVSSLSNLVEYTDLDIDIDFGPDDVCVLEEDVERDNVTEETISAEQIADVMTTTTRSKELKMIRWIKKQAKRCNQGKKEKVDMKTEKKAPKELLNHTYEEIPDVIPSVWRDIRSDTVPSFFLVGTSCVPVGDEYVNEPCVGDSEVSVTDCDYMSPKRCMENTETAIDAFNKTGDLHMYKPVDCRKTENYSKGQQNLTCSKDRLSCVRVSCHHTHQKDRVDTNQFVKHCNSVVNRPKEEFRTTQASDDDNVSLTTVISFSEGTEYTDLLDEIDEKCNVAVQNYSSLTEVNDSEDIAISEDAAVRRKRETRCAPYGIEYSRNRLLTDVIRSNYNRQFVVGLQNLRI